MRKILVGLCLVTAACHSNQVNTSTSSTESGANTSRAAVESFLAAAASGDLQSMSSVWGTENGPVREKMKLEDLERREAIMVCHFKTDSHRIVSEGAGEKNERVTRVELTKNGQMRESRFWTVQGPHKRWYVSNADVASVKDFCQPR